MSTLIADGSHTNFWSDNWLPNIPPIKLLYPSTRLEMKVADLINQEDRSWNVPLLQDLLSPEDALEVQNIKLSEYAVQDRYIYLIKTETSQLLLGGFLIWTSYFN